MVAVHKGGVCGARLAERTFPDDRPKGWVGTVELMPGFYFSSGDECWLMSKRAQARQRQGRTPAFRRRPPQADDRTPGLEGSGRGRIDQYWSRDQVDVVCPACGLRQGVHLAELGVIHRPYLESQAAIGALQAQASERRARPSTKRSVSSSGGRTLGDGKLESPLRSGGSHERPDR